jgi:hypothetical protein
MSFNFDYDAIIGPPPKEKTSKLYVLYKYTSSGIKYYRANFDDAGKRRTRTTLKSKASICNGPGALDLSTNQEWFIEFLNK